jgi:hypothetical protein
MRPRRVLQLLAFVLSSLLFIFTYGTGVPGESLSAAPHRAPLSAPGLPRYSQPVSNPQIKMSSSSFVSAPHSNKFISTGLSWSPQPVSNWSGKLMIVVGIPSTDTATGLQRRTWQRNSWLRYRGVWPKRDTNSYSLMVVNYLVGLHPANDFSFSDSLQKEIVAHHDIIGLNLREGKSTGKISGGAGYWGMEAEVGMSKKALIWYRIALEQFPQADFILKADDDIFLRVPLYLRDVAQLPRERLYYGKVMKWFARKGDPSSKFYFVGGMALLMSRDIASLVAQDHVTENVLLRDYDGGYDYKAHNADHEDVMVGRILYRLHVNHTLVSDCGMHDVHTGENKKPVASTSLVIHHLKGDEYLTLFTRFGEEATLPAATFVSRSYRSSERIDLCR